MYPHLPAQCTIVGALFLIVRAISPELFPDQPWLINHHTIEYPPRGDYYRLPGRLASSQLPNLLVASDPALIVQARQRSQERQG
jgi:hypothetical protein